MANNTHCKEVITFYLKGTFRSYNAAIIWAWDHGYFAGSRDNCGIIALQKNKIHKKWVGMTIEEKANVDGIIHSENFREGAVTINIYK